MQNSTYKRRTYSKQWMRAIIASSFMFAAFAFVGAWFHSFVSLICMLGAILFTSFALLIAGDPHEIETKNDR